MNEREFIRGDPELFKVNIRVLVNAIDESCKSLLFNFDKLKDLAPEFFNNGVLNHMANDVESFGAELMATAKLAKETNYGI
jgi:hypothetical protein